ncbi:MAG: citrate/2-methylcitrate synthase [Roseateles sp.]
MNGPDALVNSADRLSTRMGQAFVGSRAVFRGQDLHAELRHLDWMALYVLGITGRHHDDAQVKLLHALWVCTSYPDARLWNNRTAALAGSARSTPALGIAAALAMSEATIYGGHPYVSSIDFLIRARGHTEQGGALADFVAAELAQGRIYGYGRPIASVDERLPWVLGIARELQLDGGPHLRIALQVEQLLVARDARLRMNYAALMSALCADLGFSPDEMHHFQVPVFLAGMSPCFIEAAERPAGTVFPLSCDHIAYEGPAPRRWPASQP